MECGVFRKTKHHTPGLNDLSIQTKGGDKMFAKLIAPGADRIRDGIHCIEYGTFPEIGMCIDVGWFPVSGFCLIGAEK